MSQAITYWWRKYKILRDIKNQYNRKAKLIRCIGPEMDELNQEYLEKLLEAIQ